MEGANRRVHVVGQHLMAVGQDSYGPQLRASSTSAAGSVSVWSNVPQAPPDAILSISEAFKKDTSPNKINLGVGAYRTEEGKPLVLEAVRRAERDLVNDPKTDKEYAPISGNSDFCRLSALLAFGEGSIALREGRNATVQALSGTGALRVGAEFLQQHYPGPKVVYVPQPTWANHNKVFAAAGLQVRGYRYYDPRTKGVDYEGLSSDLQAAEPGSVLLLHSTAHNPTGADPCPQQWEGIQRIVASKRLLPFFDSAYQGFASGDLDKDAVALRSFADAGQELILAQSFAKNLGMYGERVGALTVITSDPAATSRVTSQLKAVIRPMYSSPPRHGAAIAARVMADPELMALWKDELRGMAGRIMSMRQQLHQELLAVGAPGNWDHVLKQIGMFSYTGLTKPQVELLTSKWHVYLTLDGRISMAGLSTNKCRYLAEAIKDVVSSA